MIISNVSDQIQKFTLDTEFVPKSLKTTDTLEHKENFFEQVLASAIEVFNETNNYQKAADIIQQDFATGKTDNMLSVLMAEQKAFSSLDFTVQVTGKVIEAYREIMRIQI